MTNSATVSQFLPFLGAHIENPMPDYSLTRLRCHYVTETIYLKSVENLPYILKSGILQQFNQLMQMMFLDLFHVN